jgi:thiol-disulfide isomerase/thioredoxin
MVMSWATGIRAIFLAIAWAGLALVAIAKAPGEVEIGEKLRDSSMQGLSGPYRRLSEFRGKPLIINVWASWCEPCRREMASLDRLARRDNGRHFAVIGISTDDYPQNAQQFLAVAKTSFSHYIDNQLLLENMLGANRIPLTVLVDANGRVLGKYYGAKEWDSPEAIMFVGKAFGFKP